MQKKKQSLGQLVHKLPLSGDHRGWDICLAARFLSRRKLPVRDTAGQQPRPPATCPHPTTLANSTSNCQPGGIPRIQE